MTDISSGSEVHWHRLDSLWGMQLYMGPVAQLHSTATHEIAHEVINWSLHSRVPLQILVLRSCMRHGHREKSSARSRVFKVSLTWHEEIFTDRH